MRRWILTILWIGLASRGMADQFTRANGEVVDGVFSGFSKGQWIFQTPDGKEVREFSISLKRVLLDPAPTVSVELVNKRHDPVVLKGYEKFVLTLQGDSGEIGVPATLLKTITVVSRPEAVAAEPEPEPVVEPPATPVQQIAKTVPSFNGVRAPDTNPRQWRQEGKWREMQTPGLRVISQGEDVDIEGQLRKGVVNVVHFHYAPAHSSVRQGNYVEVLSRKSGGRVVVQRVVVPDFNAPICAAKDLKALPQFWFYSRSGALSSKLTDRFTESDIEAALKKALQHL